MNFSNSSVLKLFRLAAIIVFDIAVLLAFFKIFFVLFLVSPIKLIFMFIVLLAGLLAFSGALLFPTLLFRRSHFAYPVSVVTVTIFYLALSNLVSLFFISGSTAWYLIWELLIGAVYIGILSVLTFFANHEKEDTAELEQLQKSTIQMQLLLIENSLVSKQNDGAISPLLHSFKALKERIHASTPFGRIAGNSAIYELENKIRDNLEFIQLHTRSHTIAKNIEEIQTLMEETRRLIIHREALNIR